MSRSGPMTKATLKDIRYALEYGGETLLKTINHERKQTYWTFAKTGRPVDRDAAEKFLTSPNCQPLHDGLFFSDSQSFAWKD